MHRWMASGMQQLRCDTTVARLARAAGRLSHPDRRRNGSAASTDVIVSGEIALEFDIYQ